MLTRALFALTLVVAFASAGTAEEAKLRGLGITDHVVTEAELENGGALPVPKFNTPAIAYAWISGLQKGDAIELHLNNEGRSLMENAETLSEDRPSVLLLAGKSGVPAGGWPEGAYSASVKVTREGKTLLEQTSTPAKFE
jgi:hypothetical protein